MGLGLRGGHSHSALGFGGVPWNMRSAFRKILKREKGKLIKSPEP